MRPANHDGPQRYGLPEAIRATIAEYLYAAFDNSDALIANLDRWTQQRIADENLAKVVRHFPGERSCRARTPATSGR